MKQKPEEPMTIEQAWEHFLFHLGWHDEKIDTWQKFNTVPLRRKLHEMLRDLHKFKGVPYPETLQAAREHVNLEMFKCLVLYSEDSSRNLKLSRSERDARDFILSFLSYFTKDREEIETKS